MWGDCQCGHGPANTHRWDSRTYRHTVCLICVQCGGKERDHSPYGHQYRRCSCLEYQGAA